MAWGFQMEFYKCLPTLPQWEGGNIKNVRVSLLINNTMVTMQYLEHLYWKIQSPNLTGHRVFYLATLILHNRHMEHFIPRRSEDSYSSARDNLSHTYERFKLLLSSKVKWGLWNPIWGHFQTRFGLFTLGTLIKSYITRKPPIAPNLKQLSQLLLPTKPHGRRLRRGLGLG